ncbi:CRISPR-associated helicase Cas3' [Streptomyces melanogenes]|uniref:CRISPR-associated helicase Cas3' n=1 Tax=Streptomyces melanogenes TaxID=67326 RepID=UPI00167D1B82|nr:CRISPR-associated helicase Cas3' [Streptomyces melanogenes]GGP80111.1 CRISPR-associated helicase/endonuclease Cas3 [Streptomyces melanogenes]
MRGKVISLVWGKAGGLRFPYPLACHLLDTAAFAGELWDALLTGRQRHRIADAFGVEVSAARGMVALWAGLHDIGKCCPSFQGQVSGPCPEFLESSAFAAPAGWMHEGAIRHERVSHLTVPSLLARFGYGLSGRPGRVVAHQVGQILGGHHGVYGPMLERRTMSDPCVAEPRVGTAAGWLEQRDALADLLFMACGRPAAPSRVAPAGVAVMVTGLVVLADWLASRTRWVLARQGEWRAAGEADWLGHFDRAVQAAPKAVSAAQLAVPAWRSAAAFDDVFPQIADPYPLQRDVAQRLPGLVGGAGMVLVTAPTGDGKTECGLFAARVLGVAAGCPGLAVLLPTMATTDAMWERVRAYVARNALEDTPVTLLHGLAWLNDAYGGDGGDLPVEDGCVATTTDVFLRQRHLGLMSAAAVGTWDQAAMAALPVRFNALRWLGLSGKTLIIDEAHAYDAYGHALTIRLLEWLGHLKVPVVLLSATLSGALAKRLVNAYRAGAGHTEPSDRAPAYPGWLFADADSGEVTASRTIESTRARKLTVDMISARHGHDPADPHGRLRRLSAQLAPLYEAAEDPGAVLVVCNTVPDAQTTFLTLEQRAGTRRPRVLLLHARMPVWQREEITCTLLNLLGPKAMRPKQPLIVVTTQIAEQSLDLDFDLVISDLAPLAQLLQRAGRGHRHILGTRGSRPSWAAQPRLVVLAPAGTLPPRAWGTVYDASLLRRTHGVLANLAGRPIDVPGDVAHMIETVYADLNERADQALPDDYERARREAAQSAAADAVAIPAPGDVTDLYPLTDREIDPAAVTTRLGADAARILPVYTTPDGSRYLDRHRTTPLPIPAPGQERLDRETVAALIRLTIQAPSTYLPADDTDTRTPPEWRTTPAASELRILPHPLDSNGAASAYRTATHTLRLDERLGLVRERHTR